MSNAKVTVLGVKKPINKIVRSKDNTDDLQDKEQKVRTRFTKLPAPDGSVPGTVKTAPPYKETPLP